MNESRWAKKDEIKTTTTKVNLNQTEYKTAGVPIISDGQTAYVDGEDTHTIVFGSTGSKKSRLFCMPMINMMIRAGESYVVTDPKGELYNKTAGSAQKNNYKVVVLNYRDIGKGDCWNPLECPYDMYHSDNKELAISMLNDFIASLSDMHRKTANDVFWIETASSLALANLLTLMECGEKSEVHVGSFAAMCTNDNIEYLKLIAAKMNPDSIAGTNYNSVFSSAEKTLQSIQISLYAWLRIFVTQKKLTSMLSKCTFDTRSIGRQKTAVYLIIPDEKTTYHFLATVFIKQVYETLISEAQKEATGMLPVRVNFVLDEFCNMPAIPDMASMISAARSRNMRYYLIVQGMNQLKSKYQEDAETIKGNCENWIFLTSKELILLNEISELCGTITMPNGVKRSLISPSELQRLDKAKGEVLILHGRNYPFITELPDIDEYKMFTVSKAEELKEVSVKYKIFSVIELHKRLGKESKVLFDDKMDESEDNQEKKESLSDRVEQAISESGSKEGINLQAELEKKFDELFGGNNKKEDN